MKYLSFNRIALIILLGLPWRANAQINPDSLKLVPKPYQIEIKTGNFSFGKAVKFDWKGSNLKPEQVKTYAGVFEPWFEKVYSTSANAKKAETISVQLILDKAKGDGFPKSDTRTTQLPDAAYTLEVQPKNKVIIHSNTQSGLMAGLSTLVQIPKLENDKDSNGRYLIPYLFIKDAPRFPWRAMHLDVCRHFMPAWFVKKYIDLLALNKMNVFHWHLTEDQGWRIEIKKYPKLTSVGSTRRETLIGHTKSLWPHKYDNTPHSGFYTQEEIKDIVAYAAARQITIVPEIEMPGHSQAAIAAYPEYGSTNEKVEVMREWGFSDHVYSPSEKTFTFLQDILDEVFTLFPGPYIHIGGDEAKKDQWKTWPEARKVMKENNLQNEEELQSWFIKRIEKYINSKGRTMIGWDEILEGGLAPNAVVMSWRGTKGGIEAAKTGHSVIMCPGSYCYFDCYQANPAIEPPSIGGDLPIEKVYSFNPAPDSLGKAVQDFIIGAQGNLWTEYVPDTDHAEWMVVPRIFAMSELLWTQQADRKLDNFKKRAPRQAERVRKLGYKGRPLVFLKNYIAK